MEGERADRLLASPLTRYTLHARSLARQPVCASSISTTVLGCESIPPAPFQSCYGTETRRLECALVPAASCTGRGRKSRIPGRRERCTVHRVRGRRGRRFGGGEGGGTRPP
ncbi:hypothetical protein NN561_008579 [Cricetulus griseus]